MLLSGEMLVKVKRAEVQAKRKQDAAADAKSGAPAPDANKKTD